MPKCRLCHCEYGSLQQSHIVSKMFYNAIKKSSPTGIMRQSSNPNIALQDGLKLPFLCAKCEELFSKYESSFSKDIYAKTIANDGVITFDSKNYEDLSLFLLSMAWRVLQYDIEIDDMTLTEIEKNELMKIVEQWRLCLYQEDKGKIGNLQQFIIPTKSLGYFTGFPRRITDNVLIDFQTLDEENTFNFAFTLIQVPYFIFITTVWGSTTSMKQYQLGKIIKNRKSQLPREVVFVLDRNHIHAFENANKKLSEKQRRNIEQRVKMKI